MTWSIEKERAYRTVAQGYLELNDERDAAVRELLRVTPRDLDGQALVAAVNNAHIVRKMLEPFDVEPLTDGWIGFTGYRCPVDPDAWVKVRFFEGEQFSDQNRARDIEWDTVYAYKVVS